MLRWPRLTHVFRSRQTPKEKAMIQAGLDTVREQRPRLSCFHVAMANNHPMPTWGDDDVLVAWTWTACASIEAGGCSGYGMICMEYLDVVLARE